MFAVKLLCQKLIPPIDVFGMNIPYYAKGIFKTFKSFKNNS